MMRRKPSSAFSVGLDGGRAQAAVGEGVLAQQHAARGLLQDAGGAARLRPRPPPGGWRSPPCPPPRTGAAARAGAAASAGGLAGQGAAAGLRGHQAPLAGQARAGRASGGARPGPRPRPGRRTPRTSSRRATRPRHAPQLQLAVAREPRPGCAATPSRSLTAQAAHHLPVAAVEGVGHAQQARPARAPPRRAGLGRPPKPGCFAADGRGGGSGPRWPAPRSPRGGSRAGRRS